MSLSQLISLGSSSASLLKDIIRSKLGSLFQPKPNHEYLLPSILSYSGFLILVCTAYKLYEKYYEGNEDKLELAGTTVFDMHPADWAKEQKDLSGQNDMSNEQNAGGNEDYAEEEVDEEENEEELDEELGEELDEDYGDAYGEEYGEMIDQRYGENYGGEYGEEYDEEDGDEYNDEKIYGPDDEGVTQGDDEWLYPDDQQGGLDYQLNGEKIPVK
ncbi:conserved Plasmodium protein, unknown function [Plasmodium knowlesi strain H]|uniref:Uncharacterized protein n=3 Tax=Plasmodium knowlesi TaxID=5850 RepID=A0A5E7WYA5_PLAKH|nr:conserved Plasmodium protein, unknown function [Plasmodium knowlesi strain H]OTN67566.1 Uncharacterized protein PKNOH_S06436700 [Plasmodium knowlesi]CAA9987637.1 conserved Plasmodium protein, unknown function [Plasmodium knowlesi strain H]SBO26960.1 conserved Plasmodium protein, unknown function [Plasmodium knowlesi strain H]SBO29274.1 conserved Plasmodium protein, unknown function [Plasmodium knowlesi strain H]VVS77111.1 conserved Plasmodium protein, unknown function [Plasmodium knowlesi s